MAKEINCESFVQWLFDEQDMFRRHFGQIQFTRKNGIQPAGIRISSANDGYFE